MYGDANNRMANWIKHVSKFGQKLTDIFPTSIFLQIEVFVLVMGSVLHTLSMFTDKNMRELKINTKI